MPETIAERLAKILTVKSIVSAGLMVVSSSAKDIYRDIDKDLKKETRGKYPKPKKGVYIEGQGSG